MLNRLNAINKVLYAMYCTRFGYVVCVPEYNGLHYTMNFMEYMEWIAAYPNEQQMIVIVKGKRITWRMNYGCND